MSASTETRVIEIVFPMNTNSMGVLSGDRNLCTTGQFALAAVDSDGHPVPVSPSETSDSGSTNFRDAGPFGSPREGSEV